MSEKYKVGDRIGRLVIIDTYHKKYGDKMVRRFTCKCDCGKVIDCANDKFRRSNPNCGCMTGNRRIDYYADMIGQVYGDLEVLEIIPKPQAHTRAKCRCKLCGQITTPIAAAVKGGRIKACSCVRQYGLQTGIELKKSSFADGTSLFSMNQSISKNNTSGYKGVSRYKKGKYRAYITFQRRQYHLGTYPTPEAAYEARKRAEQRIYGNFIEWYKSEYPDKWEKIEESINKKSKNKK